MNQISVETNVVEIETTELQILAARTAQNAIVELNSTHPAPTRLWCRIRRSLVKVTIDLRDLAAVAVAVGALVFLLWPSTSTAAADPRCHSTVLQLMLDFLLHRS
jgi:hypothetical protein